MNRIAAALLSIQLIVVLLAVPVAIHIADVGRGAAWLAGGGIALLCVLGAATVRRGRPGYVLGTAAQVGSVAAGFVVPEMLILGGIFALLWFILLRIGPQVEREKAAREAAPPDPE
ncbi:DUF4233 domain-containing protein [Jiangella endophytica]|uniref:DUF4233 domain-containing protein n=1 Tax=Jiangella endophytica TaxID=1623398 RepID=UPI000E34B0F8|nr:DUF4233 domain-containing protein [Jiangella endophytica]